MMEIIRHCPDCGTDRPFEQHHEPASWCCDSAAGFCPEWHCLWCGAGLLIGDVPVVLRGAVSAHSRDRVA